MASNSRHPVSFDPPGRPEPSGRARGPASGAAAPELGSGSEPDCGLAPQAVAPQAVASQPLAPQPPDFEQALSELEALVERLERGDLPLEEALRHFERGIALTRHCQSSLKAAQQRVEVLLRRESGEPEPVPVPFPDAEENATAEDDAADDSEP